MRRPSEKAVPCLLGVALALAWAFCHSQAFALLAGEWSSNRTYSYGFLIPLVSLYVAWTRREALLRPSPRPAPFLGVTVLATGLGALILGQAGGIMQAQAFSVNLSLAGTVLFVLGRRFVAALFFPIVYLLFMLPVWDPLLTRLHYPLQLLSAALGTVLMELVGVPVVRDEITLEFVGERLVLVVAETCSGVNSLIAVVAIGVPTAVLFLRSTRRRILLGSLGVFVAILGNSLRVALIGLLAYHKITTDIHGPHHILSGLFVSAVGFVALFTGAWALSRNEPQPPAPDRPGDDVSPPEEGAAESTRKSKMFAAILIVVFTVAGSYIHFHKTSSVPLPRPLQTFPRQIDDWRGLETAPPSLPFIEELNMDHTLSRNYRDPSGASVHLYIAYYEQQKHGRELMNRMTEALASKSVPHLITSADGTKLLVNKLTQIGRLDRRMVLFWYDINGRIARDRYHAKAYTTLDAIVRGRTNGAIILAIEKLPAHARTEDPAVPPELQRFLASVLPLLREFFPP